MYQQSQSKFTDIPKDKTSTYAARWMVAVKQIQI